MNTDPISEQVRSYLIASAEVKRQVAEFCAADIARAAELISSCLRKRNKILLCGNGGSAADCQHVAAELVGRLTMEYERPGLAAVALTTDTSFITAYANDVDYDGVFSRQVQALGKPGDVLIGISTSGESRNVVRAVNESRMIGISVVTLTGLTGILANMADVAIRVPSTLKSHIQESHLAIEHILCHLIERYVSVE
ncbi:MAG: SIS domain-containing protein [Acidobacteria bacterium]|nr:SIS domain-containing protein [Acidobacteriota bacterium]